MENKTNVSPLAVEIVAGWTEWDNDDQIRMTELAKDILALRADAETSQNHNAAVIDPLIAQLRDAGFTGTLSEMVGQVMQWIPARERLPGEHGRYVVLINALGTSLLAVAYYYPAQKCFKSISSDGETFPNVTHWRDLPEPPEST